MTQPSKLQLPNIRWTPLAVITFFAGLVDSALVVVIPQVAGNIQVALIIFVFVFTLLFFGAFIVFLWKKPYLLYSPNEWGETPKLNEFVETVSAPSPKQSDTQEKRVGTSVVVLEASIEQVKEEQEEKFNWIEPFNHGKYVEAREIMQLALANANNKTHILFIKTMSAVALSFIDLYASVSEFEKVIEEFPNEPNPYRSLARAYERTAEHTKAIEVLDRGINNVTKDKKIILKFEKLDFLVKSGKLEYMNDVKKITLEIARFPKEPKQVANAYRLLGVFFAKNKLFDKSKKAFFLAFNAARADKENLEEIADHFRDDIKDYKTELYFRTLLIDLTVDQRNFILLGNCYYMLDQYDLAYQNYKKANQIGDSPGDWVYENMGNLYCSVGLYALGIETLEQSLKITPNDIYAHERIGDALSDSKEELKEIDKMITAVKTEIENLDFSLDDAD